MNLKCTSIVKWSDVSTLFQNATLGVFALAVVEKFVGSHTLPYLPKHGAAVYFFFG